MVIALRLNRRGHRLLPRKWQRIESSRKSISLLHNVWEHFVARCQMWEKNWWSTFAHTLLVISFSLRKSIQALENPTANGTAGAEFLNNANYFCLFILAVIKYDLYLMCSYWCIRGNFKRKMMIAVDILIELEIKRLITDIIVHQLKICESAICINYI